MKQQSDGPPPDTFADKMRERLARGTDAAKQMIDRVRELVTHQDAPAADTAAQAPPAKVKPAPKEKPGAKSKRRVAKPPLPAGAAPSTETDDESVDVAPEFATATMGNLLLAQGRAEEALAVFERVLEKTPDDADAARGATKCRELLWDEGEASEAAVSPDEAPEPDGMLDRSPPPWSYGVSEARALPVDPTTVVIYWEMSEGSLLEASASAGAGATRTIELVSHFEGPGGVERIRRFVDDVPQTGDFFLRNVPPGATHDVAVGVRKGARFVPIVRCAPVRTPRGTPAPEVAQLRATVAIPQRTEGPPVARSRIVHVSGPEAAVESLVTTHATPALHGADRTTAEHYAPTAAHAPVASPPQAAGRVESMPSSIDLARRAGGPGGLGGGAPGSSSSGQWASSGQWDSSGQWASSSGQWPAVERTGSDAKK